ncbi:PREDICTED: uncharacterized protein LOC109209520 [Nicotiana attenuata]|uniref:uncharacterized protein LOC109209520 n=1 Tax=Nicotiana attenuata TaxID=49451 RepID=UPI000904E5FD|nr:PREDICTED: uncharacterized protein LOC109209520 [Nicotiana attenuata]
MTKRFLDKYFSSAKTGKFIKEIHNFCQKETETVFEAWERFKEIVRKCQHSRIELWMQLQDFWDGLTPASCRTLSNAAGGSLMKKTPQEIVTILDELSKDANQWPSESAERRKSTGVHQVDANTFPQVQLDAMAKKIRKLTLTTIQSEPHATCDICGREHPTYECQASTEEVDAMGNYNFNVMAQKHPDFSWSSPGGTANPNQPNQSSIEDLVKGFIIKTDERLDAHGAAIKELWASVERSHSDPKDVIPEKESGEQLKSDGNKKKKGQTKVEKKKKGETSRREEHDEGEHMPALPFPQKLYREKPDKQFERFLDVLKQVHETGEGDRRDKVYTNIIAVEKTAQKEKSAPGGEWKVKGLKEKAAMSEKDNCGVYPKKAEKKLSAWMCALVQARGMEPNFDSDPD